MIVITVSNVNYSSYSGGNKKIYTEKKEVVDYMMIQGILHIQQITHLKMNFKRLLTILSTIISIIMVIFFLYAQTESYCFFCPSIDTHYAKNYTEKKFDELELRASLRSVEEILGKPVKSEKKENGDIIYYYSKDGKCWWGDFAWLSRKIIIRDGELIEKEKRIYYD